MDCSKLYIMWQIMLLAKLLVYFPVSGLYHHVSYPKGHSICYINNSPVDGFDESSIESAISPNSFYELSIPRAACREAPYMTYVRKQIGLLLERVNPNKLKKNEQYKLTVLQAIQNMYTDLEQRRKPMMIDMKQGKSLQLSPSVESGLYVNGNNSLGTNLSPGAIASTTTGKYRHDNVILLHPISFCIPESVVLRTIPHKQKPFGRVIPGNVSTYFPPKEELHYYEDMQRSLFVLTFKKGGWDCLRTQEILAAGAVPLFLHIAHCPSQSLTALPKPLLEIILHQPGLHAHGVRTGLHTMDVNKLFFEMNNLDKELYRVTVGALLQYTRNVLTTKAMAAYVLRTMELYSLGKIAGDSLKRSRRILYLTHQDRDMDKGDYLTDFILMGLKELLGAEAVLDFPKRDCIYNTEQEFNTTQYWKRRNSLYGGGVSWGLTEDVMQEFEPNPRDMGLVKQRITQHYYDMVILGSGHRDGWASKLHHWDLICKHYHPMEIGWIDGSDNPTPKKRLDKYAPCAGHLFSREGFIH